MSISGVPRIYNSIYTQHKVYKDQLKNQALHEGTLTPEKKAQIKGLCKEKFSKIFGNRLNIIVTGGAPTSPQVLKFLSSTFQNTYLFNGYGTTEAGGISFNGRHYGGVQIKLVDLPEYGFTSQDLPYPRGEVVVKTTKQGSGYYKETELTKNTWTEDGFIRTGDIGVMDKAGHIRVITRIKNVCKLAQGEYVDPDKLESVYLKSKFVDQIYVDINPVKEFLVAVVVPVQQILLEHFSGEDLDQVLTSSAANEMILKDLRDLANSEQLLGYEFIQGIIIRKEPFTAENGLATASHKVCRHKIAQEYHSELEKLYSTVETSQYRTLSDQIESLFQEVINKSDSSNPDASSSQNFLSQGGDSLSALNLLKLIKDKFNVELTIEDIATDQSTPQNIAKKLTQKVASPTQPIQRSSQSENTALKQEMISDSILEPNLIPVSGDLSPVQQIFLTGATGFIGMYLLYYLLKEYSTATIVCLIRGQDKSAFLEKLRAVQIEISVEDQNRIITVNGDLAKAYLGLSEENFNELSETVDTIFHCGAYVNHFLPYSALKSANVHGTKEMIRLACFGKPKQVHYISTISVISRVSEDSPLNIAEVPLGGYSCSKWVAEQLIHQAIERGLRGAVYRPSQISGHSQTGHAIIEHYINRLLLSFAFVRNFRFI
jgi:fatty acid CoA ligase FadD9